MCEEPEGLKVVRSGFVPVFPKGHHRRNLMHMLQENAYHPGKDGYLFMNFVMHQERAVILQSEAFKLSKAADKSTAIMRKETTFVDLMNSSENCVGRFSLRYKPLFVDAGIKDVVQDTVSSGFLTMRSQEI